MKTHKIAYKHGEKLLLGSVAAVALGLINGKTKTVKASAIPSNGSALKKPSKTRLKTKLNYQTARSKLVKKAAALEASDEQDTAEAATDKPTQAQAAETDTTTTDPADDQVSENNQTGSATGNKTQTTEKSDKTDIPEKFDPTQATKAIRHGDINSIPFTFDTDAGTFTLISEEGKVTDFGKFTPVISGSNIYDGQSYTPSKDVRNIIFSGKFKANQSIKGMLANLPKLESITGLDNIDFGEVADMQDLFKGDTNLKTIEGLDNLTKASNVHDMSGMFQECSAITSLDLSSINFNMATSFQSMFANCSSLNNLILPDNIDTFNVTNMASMFEGCSKLCTITFSKANNASQLSDTPINNEKRLSLTRFDTSNVTDMSNMFKGCTSLNGLDISSFNMSKLTDEGISDILNDLPSLNILVLGKNCKTKIDKYNANLDTTGTWVNVGKGKLEKPEASKKWSSRDLIKNYDSEKDADTYVRYSGGLVTVHYLDQDRKPILDDSDKPIVDHLVGNVGQSIPVDTDKKIPGYQIAKDQDFGTFTSEPKDVNVIYNSDFGYVNVQYRDENGKPLLDKNGKVIKDSSIKAINGHNWSINPQDKDFQFDGYKLVKTDGKTSGVFDKDNPPTVTLIYTDQGKVTIHYQDENGKPLLDKNGKEIEDTILQGKIGQDKWNIDPNDYKLPGYAFVKADGKTSGIFDATNPTVTLVYTDQGKVTIHYQDENGKTLLDKNGKEIDDTILQGKIDQDKWNIDPNDYKLPGYAFVKADGKTSGIFDATNPTVTLVYTDQGKVTIHYQDENGKTLLDKNGKEIEDTILHGKIDQDKWNIDPNDYKFPGYAFVSADGKTSGIFDATNPTVNLKYTSQAQPIKVHYVDNQGKSISEDRIISGTIGQKIPVEPKEIPGYSVSEINGKKITDKGNITLYLSDKPQEITYTYTQNSSSTPNKAKAPNVTVHYQDEYGNILTPNVVLEGYVGDGYTSETKSISGYTLKTRPNNATGFFTTFPQDVTYIYSKNETNINQITDKQPDNNKPTKVPTIKKPKRKPTRHLRNINRRKQLDKKSSIPTKLVQRKTITQQANSTNNKHSSSLPQTGKNQHSSLAMLTLGGIALISAFSLAWLDRKKE
ncbi:MucBP domain-containing protein [Lactobacillus juensis]|uniref:MucBP domain-containing protein n=1 Tax=Lactobacillus juensis TaxID=3082862 RepID=UPI0030C6E61B